MPIYEFYCPDCHMIFSFLSRTAGRRKRPRCPKCGRPRLAKKPSSFAISKGLSEPAADGGFPELDEGRMERAMTELARQAEEIGEDDPSAVAGLMRRFYESSGVELTAEMEEAFRRLENGEDPEKIEEEMGDLLEEQEPLFRPGGGGLKELRRRVTPPQVDSTLYEL
jgi:putative FmdB family regulatory protein